MPEVSVFDVIGPVMVGPSSSHTAGAVRIGNVCRNLLGGDIARAEILFYGSFLMTGKGHGTDRAIVAGLLGMAVDDPSIPDSLSIAGKRGLIFSFGAIDLKNAHPNTVRIKMTGTSGKQLEVTAASVGGGRIEVCELDGLEAHFSGEHPTLIVHNVDQPGHVAEVTAMLEHRNVNIATMQLYRSSRGGKAVMVMECDEEVPADARESLKRMDGIVKVTYLSLRTEQQKIPEEGQSCMSH